MVTVGDIRDAAERIRGLVIRTPVVYSPTFSSLAGAEVYLKLENLQRGGSFKVRGAMNRILASPGDVGKNGVIAASAGNHAQGVALAAREVGIPATIVMPRWVSPSKEEATRAYGASVILEGESLDESIAQAQRLASDDMTFIHPYDDDAVIAGQGTVALELLSDLPDIDQIIVPIGGGGLIAGIAIAAKAQKPGITITGVQAHACPSASASREAGRPVTVKAGLSIADGIMVRQTGSIPFAVMQELVDELVIVDEEALTRAVFLLLERKKVLAEGAGAAGLAALLSRAAIVRPGSKVAIVISGGNVDGAVLDRIMRRMLVAEGRLMSFSTVIDDTPAALASLFSLIAEQRGTVVRFDHARPGSNLGIREIKVELEVETRSHEHIASIYDALTAGGLAITFDP
jgi:threonine dehydratase